jgi:gluconolactonase
MTINWKRLFILTTAALSTIFAFGEAQSPLPSGAIVQKLYRGFIQPEGPVWVDSIGLLLSDIQGNKIYEWSKTDGSVKSFLNPSYNSNGLALDRQGRLILTQMGLRRVSRREFNGTIISLASTFRGIKFNSPNDVVVKSDSSIFFTDPDYNIPSNYGTRLNYQGIYRISPSGTVALLDSTLNEPNGICFSPDEKTLYVNDSHKCIIYAWDVVDDSVISGKRVFYTLPTSISEDNINYADGMKTDSAGNIYCTGPMGIWIVSSSGTYLDKISMSKSPSNCAWGDADRKTLYITATDSSLYKIRFLATDVKNSPAHPIKLFQLSANYPNPFNPSTVIKYRLSVNILVTLKIYDMLGKEVATLVNAAQPAGDHVAIFDGSAFPSGVYFYTLRAGAYMETKKLMLIK